MITTGSFSAQFSLLDSTLRTIFESDMRSFPKFAEQVLYVDTSSKIQESFRTMGGFGAPSVYTEGGLITYDDPAEGYLKHMTHTMYALGFQVTEKMWDDDQHAFIKRRPSKLARSMQVNVETIGAGVFNSGFDTYTTADGQYLFATGHTLIRGGTYANKPSTDIDLSIAGIEAALTNLNLITDDAGTITPYQGKTLMVSAQDEWTARKLLGSEKDPDSANNTINPLKGGLTILVNPYLTDTDAWFILCEKSDRELGPMLLWRKRPDFKSDTNIDNRTMKWNSLQRYSVGAVDWRGVYGSSGG
jgi:hypothetical protein